MTFSECVSHCAVPELVREFNRLTGFSLGEGSPIEQMIDRATGRDEDAMRHFVAFVFAYIWLPLTFKGRA